MPPQEDEGSSKGASTAGAKEEPEQDETNARAEATSKEDDAKTADQTNATPTKVTPTKIDDPAKQSAETTEGNPSKEDDANAASSTTNDDGLAQNKRKTANLPQRPLKRARTAYFIFADDRRSKLQTEHPGEGVAFIARKLGQVWSTLDPAEKQKYQERAAEERKRVAEELEAWKAAGGSLDDLKVASQAHSADSTVFPVARIRKICKLDPDVRGLSKEALLLVTKCAEYFTAQLGKEAVKVAQIQNRRKLLPDDVAQICTSREPYLFLKDDVRDLVQDQMEQKRLANLENDVGGSLTAADHQNMTAADAKKVSSKKTANAEAAAGSKPLTSYFTTSAK